MRSAFFSARRLSRPVFACAGMLLALSACEIPHDESRFYSRGRPEALLDVSSEVVNLGVASKSEVSQLANWIAKDVPTRAELFCMTSSKECKTAQSLLRAKGVETNVSNAPDNVVTLVYERILARDCNQRFIDDRVHRLSNEPSPAFGCSIAANTVQHVSNKRDFISPALSDNPPAAAAVATYRGLSSQKKEAPQKYTVEETSVKTKTE